MDWNVFFSVITWAITVAAGVTTFISVATFLTENLSDRGVMRALVTAAISSTLLVLGIATLNGMGWTE